MSAVNGKLNTTRLLRIVQADLYICENVKETVFIL